MQARTVIAVNRFGLGATPGQLQRVAVDPANWLLEQIKRPAPAPDAIARLPDSASVLLDQLAYVEQRRAIRADGALKDDTADRLQAAQKAHNQSRRAVYLEQALARVAGAVSSQRPFTEHLTHFWTNHFAVSADKEITRTLAATLEHEAIRPNVAGRFADLLLAVEQHPAMITYLDNQVSIGPHSVLATQAQKRRGNQLGLNENLAREILELHTLGVNGGYTQADVVTFAHVLTGWTVGSERWPVNAGKPGHFYFSERLHEPGAQRLLGKKYRAGGQEQGEAVLRDLALHRSTARHIATKLVRHFIADVPPAAAVERVARAFVQSEGDLGKVYAALVACPEAWALPPAKLKTPQEFVVSTFRALDLLPEKPEQAVGPLRMLGQAPYMPGSPAGWPDTRAAWGGADALMKRIEWANAIGRRLRRDDSPIQLANWSLGPLLSEHSETAIRRASSPAQGLTLLLVSPEFQRR